MQNELWNSKCEFVNPIPKSLISLFINILLNSSGSIDKGIIRGCGRFRCLSISDNKRVGWQAILKSIRLLFESDFVFMAKTIGLFLLIKDSMAFS